jgi:hypothetical protein
LPLAKKIAPYFIEDSTAAVSLSAALLDPAQQRCPAACQVQVLRLEAHPSVESTSIQP